MSVTTSNKNGIRVVRLADGPSFAAAMVAVTKEREPFVLESTVAGGRGGRFSILGFDPVDTVEIAWPCGSDWPGALADRIGTGDPQLCHPGLPFVGGWVGFIAYEAGPALENVPCTKTRDLGLPAARFSLYDTVAVYDHSDATWSLAAVETYAHRDRPPARDRIDRLAATLRSVAPPPEIDWTIPVADEPVSLMSREDYFDRVRSAKRYITAGDIYQANITQRFTTRTTASPIELYRRLRVANPSAYAALLTHGDTAILSASPELFLELRGRRIVTRPIKGTRPRVGDAVLDAVQGRELLASEKDRAELTMIIDLMRNDLGRVSDFGTVRVESLFDLEAHPTVLHLVSTISGRLRAELNWPDLLRATFPGGSITGCPKIRAMQIIDELETTERGVYCGSIGYIGLDGSMCLNIAIRTMVLDRGALHLFGGGAIVADSQPQSEYEETFAKIAGMTRALRGRHPLSSRGGAFWERSA